ncbi:MAG: NAD(P)-dependent oxidoreductase [Pseudomonadota bacterium]
MVEQQVGFIGLGRMGGGMARNLAAAGQAVRAFDLSEEAVRSVVNAGATAALSPADAAAGCDVVFLCVPAAAEVRDVLFHIDGNLASAHRGLTVIDTSTLDRGDAIAIAEEAGAAGLTYCDCPVSGMPFRAEAGTLTVMFGGPGAVFAQVRPHLETFGETIVHCGPVGAGQAMKAINNILYNVHIAALAEVLPLTVAAGLDTEAVAKVVTTASARSFASDYFVPRMLAGKFDTDFTMNAARKDVVNVQAMAAETGARLPVVDAMTRSYDAAIAAGFGEEPKSAMLKVYEQALGVEFRGEVED